MPNILRIRRDGEAPENTHPIETFNCFDDEGEGDAGQHDPDERPQSFFILPGEDFIHKQL